MLPLSKPIKAPSELDHGKRNVSIITSCLPFAVPADTKVIGEYRVEIWDDFAETSRMTGRPRTG
jgi:hypothetical protein